MEVIAAATAGELLWFDGKPAFTPYTGDCGGRTEDAAAAWPDLAAPYLKSRADEYCGRAGESGWKWDARGEEIAIVLRRAGLTTPQVLERISIVDRTVAGRARTLLLAGRGWSVRISASSFRFAIGRELGWNLLRSDRYSVHSAGGRVSFDGAGAGHGVGLCQRGAEQMGRDRRTYREILAYYYPGTRLGVNAQGIPWQRLSGETVTILTVRPDRDRFLLARAERLLRSLAQRAAWPVPRDVEVRVYPDVDTFRNATGEPGWVAGYTDGRRIHLQPGAAEISIGHELAHVLVESQAVTGLPFWFREGLAGFLGSPAPVSGTRPAEADLRDRSDAVRARRAESEAVAAVSGLVKRYGEATVLGWVARGLPPEVRNASSSREAAKSK
jgi:stage II sporulation protein D